MTTTRDLIDNHFSALVELTRIELITALREVPLGIIRQIDGRVEKLANGQSIVEIQEFARKTNEDSMWGMFA